MSRNWSDQPEELEAASVVLSTFMDFKAVGSHGVEIRYYGGGHGDPERWYLTTGNLFGSQTVRCQSAENVLRCLNEALHAKKGEPISVVRWGELMEPPAAK